MPSAERVGHSGESHPKVCEARGPPARAVAFEFALNALMDVSGGSIAQAVPLAASPLAKEDFAFVVDAAVPAGALVAVLREAGGELVEDVRVFDVYAGAKVGDGKNSMAVNVVMRAPDGMLTSEELLAVRQALSLPLRGA